MDDQSGAGKLLYGMTQWWEVQKAIREGGFSAQSIADAYMNNPVKVNSVLKSIVDSLAGVDKFEFFSDAEKNLKVAKAADKLAKHIRQYNSWGQELDILEYAADMGDLGSKLLTDYTKSLEILESLRNISFDNPTLNATIDNLIFNYNTYFVEKVWDDKVKSFSKKAIDAITGSSLGTLDLFLGIAFNQSPSLKGLDKVITINSFKHDLLQEHKRLVRTIKSGEFTDYDVNDYKLVFSLCKAVTLEEYKAMRDFYPDGSEKANELDIHIRNLHNLEYHGPINTSGGSGGGRF